MRFLASCLRVAARNRIPASRKALLHPSRGSDDKRDWPRFFPQKAIAAVMLPKKMN